MRHRSGTKAEMIAEVERDRDGWVHLEKWLHVREGTSALCDLHGGKAVVRIGRTEYRVNESEQ
jgi:hypothetical protein